MSDEQSTLKTNPHIAATPLYVAGTSIEAIRQKYGLDEVVKLASNESPLGPSPKAVAAIQAAAADIHRYPPAAADGLREALAAHFGRGLTAQHFVTANGGTEMIDLLVRAYVGEGDNVVICRPTFPMYEISTRRCGGEMNYADLDADFAYDVDGVLSAIDERTRIVFLCTPNNPSGTILPPETAAQLVAGIPERVLVAFDESYRLFVEDESQLVDTVGYVLERPNVASLRSFSKTHGLAGLRIGYTIAPPEVATYVQRLRNPFHITNLALRGAIAALDDDEHVERVRRIVIEERRWLAEQLAQMGLEVIFSESNFIAAKADYPPDTIYERLLAKGIIIRPMALFYLPEWFRVTVGRREENERFLSVLESELQALAAEGMKAELASGDGKVAV